MLSTYEKQQFLKFFAHAEYTLNLLKRYRAYPSGSILLQIRQAFWDIQPLMISLPYSSKEAFLAAKKWGFQFLDICETISDGIESYNGNADQYVSALCANIPTLFQPEIDFLSELIAHKDEW